ncbi:MAG: glycosyltransferase [Pseudonocardiaceae bacterium]|nr:glycosyltransferase [Pseudonocardiaceae bacterium]
MDNADGAGADELDRHHARVGELTESLAAERERAERLRAELERQKADAAKLLAERDEANERLRARAADLDSRLGLALGELADVEQEREGSRRAAAELSAELSDVRNRLRNATAALRTTRSQLALARRVPGLSWLINRRSGDELFYALELPDEPVHCGRAQVIELSGWVAHGTARVRSVSVLVDGMRWPAIAGEPRPDVAGNLAADGIHAQRDSGVRARVVLPRRATPGDVRFELEVRLSGGRRIRRALGSVRVLPGPEPRPLPVRWPGGGSRVAICLTTYNPDREFLARQLDSLRAQTHRNWVCIVCDDGSSRAARRTVAELTAGDDRFVLVENDRNVGFYRNFERALHRVPADADAIALSDQDDVWDPSKLARLLEPLRDPDVQLVYSDMRLIDRHGSVLADSAWLDGRNQCADLVSLLLLNTVTGAASVLRPELVRERVLPFPPETPATYHDQWMAACALATGRVVFVDEPLYSYRQHGDNVTGWQLPQLDRGLPGIATLLALGAGFGGERWLRGLPASKRGELHHIAAYELRRITQFATLLLARNGDTLSTSDVVALRKLRMAERRLAPLVELAVRAKRERRRHTAGAELRLLAAAVLRAS